MAGLAPITVRVVPHEAAAGMHGPLVAALAEATRRAAPHDNGLEWLIEALTGAVGV
jgi:hypothetical protein